MLRNQLNSTFHPEISIELAFTKELTRVHAKAYPNVFDNVGKKYASPILKLYSHNI